MDAVSLPVRAVTPKAPRKTGVSAQWFNGIGCGFGTFGIGVGYGLIVGGGIGYGPGMPYARPTWFFGLGFGSFVGVGLGMGRMIGVNLRSPDIDWEEVILGQRSWGVNTKKKKNGTNTLKGNGSAKALTK